jgi:hypothetical protein
LPILDIGKAATIRPGRWLQDRRRRRDSIALAGGKGNQFLTMLQGECVNCHKPNEKT